MCQDESRVHGAVVRRTDLSCGLRGTPVGCGTACRDNGRGTRRVGRGQAKSKGWPRKVLDDGIPVFRTSHHGCTLADLRRRNLDRLYGLGYKGVGPMTRRNASKQERALDNEAFDHLSAEERAVVGDPDEYQNAARLPARSVRTETAQFSLRLPRTEFIALQELAARKGVSFSEVAREALSRYVQSGGAPGLTSITIARSAGFLLAQGSQASLPSNRASRTADDVFPASMTSVR